MANKIRLVVAFTSERDNIGYVKNVTKEIKLEFKEMFKIICYSVLPNETTTFAALNTDGYSLTLVAEPLTAQNLTTAQGNNAVLLADNGPVDREMLTQLAAWGIKYVFTRTTDCDFFDFEAADELNQVISRIPVSDRDADSAAKIAISFANFKTIRTTGEPMNEIYA
ncbi:Rossmann-fold NAD(P)-binding domain-containing protein [Periweissella fabalis]|uniref:D-isomer specific 2-hydroxyacid dehydrogenase catalytic domain-containing protein n=1 Tax=Periweissella fabalis TaxID=1070421 RepID=A0A7X6N2H7_9LACO|nr:hypothetical protein [Periweissella fabalis]MCM0599861.1 hypothetical protein [Periweissella fabalis]NKZ24084.1 hypothetical protein [Periweissella fabalis]